MFPGLRVVACHCGCIGGRGSVSRLSPPIPGPRGSRVTPAVHCHEPAPFAPVVSADRKGAHGRVNSDRAVDRPCSRLIRAWRACP